MRPRFLSLVLDDGRLATAGTFVDELGPHRGTLVVDAATLEREGASWKKFLDAGHDLAVRVPLRLATSEAPESEAIRGFAERARKLVQAIGGRQLIVRVGEPIELPVPADAVLQGGGAAIALEPVPSSLARIRPWVAALESEHDCAAAAEVFENAAPGSWLVLALEGFGENRLPAQRFRQLLATAERHGWTLRTVGDVLTPFGPPGAFEATPDLCGNLDRPGAALSEAHRVDYSAKGTTPDQLRIEHLLEKQGVDGRDLLHVGVGNSSLARRFASRARRIVGLTVAENELRAAEALRLPNYRVHLESKYSPRIRALEGGFDVIVDNNLASFACCRYHLYAMFDAYLALLKPGGRILTDVAGMQWSAGDARFKLTYADLLKLERKLPFAASRVTEFVYALSSLRD